MVTNLRLALQMLYLPTETRAEYHPINAVARRNDIAGKAVRAEQPHLRGPR